MRSTPSAFIIAITLFLSTLPSRGLTPEEAAAAAVRSLRNQGLKVNEADVLSAIRGAAARSAETRTLARSASQPDVRATAQRLLKDENLPKYSVRLARAARDVVRSYEQPAPRSGPSEGNDAQ